MTLLDARALHVAIGGRAILSDVSFSIARGETLGLVGASGSGKSMTALALLNLLPARAVSSGQIRLGEHDLLRASDSAMQRIRGRDIGIVFQEPATALNVLMTVLDQVAEVVQVHLRTPRRIARERAAAALHRVGLAELRGLHRRYPHELSGGQRQRAAIAMALVLEPALLIADEPTTALDARSQQLILDLLAALVKESQTALLFISHDLGVVARMARRVAVLQGGRIVETGETASVFTQPQEPYTRSLIAASTLRPLRAEACDTEHASVPSTRSSSISTPLLSINDLVCEYSHAQATVRAVDGVSFEVAPGESVGIVGESGAGKSTLLRALLGVGTVQAGEIRLLGQPFASPGRSPERSQRRHIQCVLQDPGGSLDPRWSVRDLIAEPLHLAERRPSRAQTDDMVARLLERVGLSPAESNRRPHEFSGGQRQRIAIARALVLEPDLVVLDEAVSALDVFTRAQILELLAELSREFQIAYVFVSHDLDVMRVITDRVLVLEQGRIVEEGPTERVLPINSRPSRLSQQGSHVPMV